MYHSRTLRLAMLLAIGLAGSAAAQDDAAAFGLVRDGTAGSDLLDLKVERLEAGGETRSAETLVDGGVMKIGDRVRICFQARKDGYVTLWSTYPDGRIERIFPNRFTEQGEARRAMLVEAGKETCLGEDRSWGVEVKGPPGDGGLYLHWTPTAELNLTEADFPSLQLMGKSVRSRSLRSDYASARLKVEVRR